MASQTSVPPIRLMVSLPTVNELLVKSPAMYTWSSLCRQGQVSNGQSRTHSVR